MNEEKFLKLPKLLKENLNYPIHQFNKILKKKKIAARLN